MELGVRVLGDRRFDDIGDELERLIVDVLALEDLAALVVDDVALLVHDLVVLENVLADLEVHALDLGLRPQDRLRHDLGFDRDVVGDLEAFHHRGDAVGGEQAHEVVLEREVEPALARVALSSGTTTQLVVDTTRLVPLGTENVEAAALDDLLVLHVRLLLELLEERLELFLVRRLLSSSSYSSRRYASLSHPAAFISPRAMPSALPPRMMSTPRPAMFVATVTASRRPACATISASLSWFFALRTSCGIPRFLRTRERCSDFSTDTVPISTG